MWDRRKIYKNQTLINQTPYKFQEPKEIASKNHTLICNEIVKLKIFSFVCTYNSDGEIVGWKK